MLVAPHTMGFGDPEPSSHRILLRRSIWVERLGTFYNKKGQIGMKKCNGFEKTPTYRTENVGVGMQ